VVSRALGDIDHYIEPFVGGASVLLNSRRYKRETINDFDGLVSNFWRTVSLGRFEFRPMPTVELDLQAWNTELIASRGELAIAIASDPMFCDPRLAHNWLIGQCASIGGWTFTRSQRSIRSSGCGVLSDAGPANLAAACARLAGVRVFCGDFERVLVDSQLQKTRPGVYLDPPYAEGDIVYHADDPDIAARVWKWAIENGDQIPVVVSGYADNRTVPAGWDAIQWTARQGMARGSSRRKTETLWCSPRCQRVGNLEIDFDNKQEREQ
jgi:hypothetical protein